MSKRSSIHWKAPTTVLLAVVIGTLFALGHHLFYASLDGHPAPNDDYTLLGSNFSKQQLNIAGGTAFAFLVRASLVTALSTAYIQMFWRAMTHRAREATLDSLDTTFSALNNIFSLLKLWAWWRHPLLWTLALAAWLLPLAAIVTPATLSVISAPVAPPRTSNETVPNVGFVSLNYVDSMTPANFQPQDGQNLPVEYYYQGPSKAVEQVVQAVAAEGSRLTVVPPAPNATWTLDFPGPALQCQNVSDSSRSAIQANVVQAMNSTAENSCKAYGFLAWTSTKAQQNSTQPLPFTKTGNNSYVLNSGPLNYNNAPASLYLAAMPDMMQTVLFGDHSLLEACMGDMDSASGRKAMFANATMVQCELVNATYHTDFKFINGEQHVDVDVTSSSDEVLKTVQAVYGPPSGITPGSKLSSPSCSVLNDNHGQKCAFDQQLLSMLSYQAIMHAFNALLVGSLYVHMDQTSTKGSSGIMDTILVGTPELRFLTENDVITSLSASPSLQNAAMSSNGTLFNGIVNSATKNISQPLIRAMENVFQDITISMMSSKKLQPNTESAFAPPLTKVTYNTYHNVYAYSPTKLWIAYGVAILFAVISSLMGLFAIAANGASYSHSFSSIFRFARGATMSVELKHSDTFGRDPLPNYLSRAKIWLNGHSVWQGNGDGHSLDNVADTKSATASSSLLTTPAAETRSFT